VRSYSVVFAPEAEDSLVSLYQYIAERTSPSVAERYTDAVVTYCESFATFPNRGLRRDDIRPGLRITNYKRRTVIAFAVDDEAGQVAILGVFYGGRDYERVLGGESEDDPTGEP